MSTTSESAQKRPSRSLSAPVTAMERVLSEIERHSSRNPFGHQQASRQLIDVEILRGYADPDEIAYEESVCRSHSRGFARIEDFGEVSRSDEGVFEISPSDFRDGLDACDCECKRGCVCIKCCTQRDLMALPAHIIYERRDVHEVPVLGHMVEVFDLVMSREQAVLAGLIAA